MPPKSAAARREPQPPRRPLRSIPGGYDIDRWPICVPIGPEETIQSWLMRAALRYGVTPRALLATAGVEGHIDRPAQFAAAVSRHMTTWRTCSVAPPMRCVPRCAVSIPTPHCRTTSSDTRAFGACSRSPLPPTVPHRTQLTLETPVVQRIRPCLCRTFVPAAQSMPPLRGTSLVHDRMGIEPGELTMPVRDPTAPRTR
jgi:hypothetical protein